MSRYQGSYDVGESRRSPRDQSPGRYNDSRDDFRGGVARGGERRRSISDTRMNHNSVNSNRELFREPTSREVSRDFPPREPPRGPKGFPDAPTGPRASGHSTDFRADFGGFRGDFRGDFRGERGRGRGRGWREDSRDRGRDLDRDYRDRRDERPAPFREDRGRDRWGGREPYRGRRASSPQGRGRSPNYGPRDSRDGPPNIEIDRARRGSRDGPLSGGSPASESLATFGRGYSRAPRGGRGRGRGTFYEDNFHRPPGRSRSPEPAYRRTQPSATPPPQVPAFGSTAAPTIPPNIPNSPPNRSAALTTDPAFGPVPGVAVPTAPRAHGPDVRGGRVHNKPASLMWASPRLGAASQGPEPQKLESALPTGTTSMSHTSSGRPLEPSATAESHEAARGVQPVDDLDIVAEDNLPAMDKAAAPRKSPDPESLINPRRLIGKRTIEAPVPPSPQVADELSDSESEDELTDGYFEDEISKIEAEITNVKAEIAQKCRPEPPAVFLTPFIESTIDLLVEGRKLAIADPCEPPEVKVEEAPLEPEVLPPLLAPKPKQASRSRSSTPALAPKPKSNGRSRPSTPLVDPRQKEAMKSATNGESTANYEPVLSARTPLPSVERPETPTVETATPLMSIEPASESFPERLEPQAVSKPLTNGTTQKSAPMDVFSESEGEMTEAENEEMLEAVRPRMKTPPISSLPNFGNKKWTEDADFLATLKPNLVVEARIKQKLIEDSVRIAREQSEARELWGKMYHEYRTFTDFSNEAVAVRSRENFAKARAQAAAEAAAPHTSSVPSAGAKPEGTRRTGRLFATDHELERVLRESEQEARESKDKEERAARAKTASAKEATIPDAAWNKEEWQSMQFVDRSHLVPFERSFAILEYGEPIDNFTEEESEIFEKVYLEFPKQWSKIAAALPRRNYKACIQHYYLVKHNSSLKEKLKKQPKKRKSRTTKPKNPKSNALIADLGPNRDDTEDGQDAEGGERRGRPRRAAAPTFNFENPASESEVASPAPTPGRKTVTAPKGDAGTDAPPTKKKAKVGREKGSKQAKNSQLLAAAPPIAAANRRAESPATPVVSAEWKNRHEPSGTPRFPIQYDGAGPSQNQPSFAPPYVPVERPTPSMAINFDPLPQQFPTQQERLDSAPPMNFESQQDRQRNIQQTSSYWSVPEQNDFPALLKHFGTDWHGIAKWMTSKTHIMVKNYYQRQVDSGKKDWEAIAKEADGQRERNEPTGPLPAPTIMPKRRLDGTPHSRSVSAMDQAEDLLSPGQSTLLPQTSSPQPLSARFPALAQAGPVPQIQPPTATSTVLNKHMPPQPIQQAPPQTQQQPRPPRGPPKGFFSTESPRPVIQSDAAISQRSFMVAQEAQIERTNALRLEQEQRNQQLQREQQQQQQQREQQQAIQKEQQANQQREQLAMQQQREQQVMQQREQAMQRDRHFHMKQEHETPSPQQYEPYSTPSMVGGIPPQARLEPPKPNASAPPEIRRTAPPQQPTQYQPRSTPSVRNFPLDAIGGTREIKSTPSPALSRGPMSAPPANQEMYSAPPPPPPPQHLAQAPPHPQSIPAAPVRQPEPARKSNIMSLLNDEPSDPRPTPTKRHSDVSINAIQTSRTPPPQHQAHSSRYSTQPAQHTPQHTPQQQAHVPQQMASQAPSQPQAHPSQHAYSQPPQHSLHQHSSSIGHTRSYTPTGFDNRPGYGQSQMQQQQQIYSQPPPRQSITSQPPQIRREPSHGDIHGMSGAGGYARSSAPSQPSMRLKESPYSATPQPQPPQSVRQSIGSPHDLPLDQRDFYQRQPQSGYFMQQQQQHSATASPQLGPSYQSHSQQPQQPAHRQLAFGQNSAHAPSPPSQYATHHSLHASRHNSFDGRYQMDPSVPAQAQAAAHSGYQSQPAAARLNAGRVIGRPRQTGPQQPPFTDRERAEEARSVHDARNRVDPEREYYREDFPRGRQ